MEERIKQALAALGDTPDAIAASLASRGVVGDQCKTASCPIAAYVAKECASEGQHVIVDLGSVEVFLSEFDTYPVSVLTPPHVREFIRKFDDGHYRDLATQSTGPAAVIACH